MDFGNPVWGHLFANYRKLRNFRHENGSKMDLQKYRKLLTKFVWKLNHNSLEV